MYRHDTVTQTSGVIVDEENGVEILYGSAIMQGSVEGTTNEGKGKMCEFWDAFRIRSGSPALHFIPFRIVAFAVAVFILFCVCVCAGWRQTQEDALSCLTGVYPGTNALIAIFSVFDGHGGRDRESEAPLFPYSAYLFATRDTLRILPFSCLPNMMNARRGFPPAVCDCSPCLPKLLLRKQPSFSASFPPHTHHNRQRNLKPPKKKKNRETQFCLAPPSH